MQLRAGTTQDISFLKQMLFEAFFWNPQTPRPDVDDFFSNPEFYKLLSRWGRKGDRAVIAEKDNKSVGAAWFRLWTQSNHSYGFIDFNIPELGIGILPGFRSIGIGRMLLKELVSVAHKDGFAALSLSVDPANFARKLYESEGFVKVAESGTYKLQIK